MRKGFFVKLALTGIRKNRKIYYPYTLTAIITVAMLYLIKSLSNNPGLRSSTLLFTLELGVFVTTAFSVIFLFYTNSFLIKRRKKEFGLYNILGMEKKHIGRVVFWETLVILLASLLIGFALGLLLDKLLFMLLLRVLGDTSGMIYRFSPQAIVYTAGVVSVTFFAILLYSLAQIHLANPIQLLRGGQVGEKEPKTKWILTILGVLTLGFGYWISVAVTNTIASVLLFFAAVMLVIAGTYLLFTTGSITGLKLLRKNKRYYYKPSHFINVSGMIYRMKQNAVGLGNVCILSTMVLVMIFSTVSLWFGMEDTLNQSTPYDIEYVSFDYDKADAIGALADEQIAKAGLQKAKDIRYTYLEFAGFRQDDTYLTDRSQNALELFSENLTDLYFIPLESYNAAMGTDEQLADNEILIHSKRDMFNADILRVFDDAFTIKERPTAELPRGMASASMYATQYIIVKDMNVILSLYNKQLEAYGEHASRIRFYEGLDLDGPDAQKSALAESLNDALRANFALQRMNNRLDTRVELMHMYGGLLFIGLFLGALFIMAMILIIYYKQISEGYDDRERYQIMQKVGLSLAEIKRSIGSQILTVFFLPLVTAGLHILFAFPSLTRMFAALNMTNIPLMVLCALVCFVIFSALYGVVYYLTAKVYYRIVSQ